MRVRNLNAGAYNADGTVNINNFTATGPFYVYQEPVGLRDIASKAYVDLKTTSFDTAYFTSGTLAVARMPAFTGQLSKPAGSAAVTVSVGNTAAAGTYSSITVGAHGFVTAAGQLSSADVPSFSWTKITSGKPTTLAGWGITNALAKSGGTVTGPINISGAAAQTNPLHAVTKSIADAAITGMTAGIITYRTGDIRMLPTAGTPAGYLRCNGAVLNKTSYASLYAVVGDTYRNKFIPGAGRPWAQQNFNDSTTSAVIGWSNNASTALVYNIWYGGAVVVTKNRIHLLGGENGGGPVPLTQSAPVSADGTIGAWAAGAVMPVSLSRSAVVVTKNRVYLIGGYVTSSGATTAIQTAVINADGTLGTFTEAGVTLPQAMMMASVIYTGSRVYAFGGSSASTSLSSIHSAPVDASGVIGAWVTESNTLAYDVHSASICVTSSMVYLIGGYRTNVGAPTTMQYAPINSDGTIGSWTTSATSIPSGSYNAMTFNTKNRVFLIGGVNAAGAIITDVYTAVINADGTVGSWTTYAFTGISVTGGRIAVTKDKVNIVTGLQAGGTTYTQTQVASTVGGLSDYSPYYDGSITATASTDFQIPTITSNEGIGLYAYIKT